MNEEVKPAEPQSIESLPGQSPSVPEPKPKDDVDARHALDAEKQQIDLQRQWLTRHMQLAQQSVPAPLQTAEPGQMLVEQFGHEGAQAIQKLIEQERLQSTRSQFELLYGIEEEKGKAKYGDGWSKHDYFDPMSGERKNRIMDLRIKGVPLDQAWHAVNPIDGEALRQQIRDEVYAEMSRKERGTPVSSSSMAPSASGEGHAGTVAEAYQQALAELTGK